MFDLSDITAFGTTDQGLRRSLNEDACLVDISACCFAVADGVGGAAAGEVASRLFITTVSEVLKAEERRSEQNGIRAIEKTFLQANGAIYSYAAGHPESHGMACTAEVLLFYDNGFALGHVGDSRTYRFRDNKLKRLTRDHSFVQEQLDSGKITENEARHHRYRNVILRAVGSDESIDVDIIRGGVQPGDMFLLCSDGLTDMVSEPEITTCLQGGKNLSKMAGDLVSAANNNGGKDNITVILVLVNG